MICPAPKTARGAMRMKSMSVASYNAAIKSISHVPDHWEAAFLIRQDMEERGVPLTAETYDGLLAVCLTSGRYSQGGEVWEAYRTSGLPPSPDTLDLLIELCHRTRDWRKACDVIDHLKTFARADNDPETQPKRRSIQRPIIKPRTSRSDDPQRIREFRQLLEQHANGAPRLLDEAPARD